ncbi:MAG: hypothetical protein ACLQVM_03410 [Terriglobia bacterium]
MRTKKQDKKVRLDNIQALTPRERELLAFFRVMTEPDRRLLLSTAGKLISTEAASSGGTPDH